MSAKRVTVTLDNLDGLDLFFKLMRDDVDKVLATNDIEAIRAKLTEVQGVRLKLLSAYKRHIKNAYRHTQSYSYVAELYKALTRISSEQFNLVLAKLIAGLKDCAAN